MKKILLSVSTLGLTALTGPASAAAGDMEHQVTQQMIKAYGGEKLRGLEYATITNNLRQGWLGQGRTFEFVEMSPMVRVQQLDFKNMRGRVEAAGGAGAFNNGVIVSGGEAQNIDYMEGVYAEPIERTFHQVFGGDIRSNDLLLARDVMAHPGKLTFKASRYYENALHHVIEFDMEGTENEPVLWINSETGYISRMERQMPDFKFQYVFGNRVTERGLTYAKDFTLFMDDHVAQYTKSRDMKFGKIRASAFTPERNLLPEPESVDSAEMNVDEVAPGLYQTGQGGAFSAFVDAGDHVIAVGLYGGLKERYDAYTEAHGPKPLKYVIATHHHEDHVAGTPDALELGAIIVAPAQSKSAIALKMDAAIPEDKLELIAGKARTVGPVELHMIDTPHASDYALVYIPSAKAVFQEDHYGGDYVNRASKVNAGGAVLRDEIVRLGLDVETLLSGHGRKQESWSAFSAAADAYKPSLCPTGRKICRNMR